MNWSRKPSTPFAATAQNGRIGDGKHLRLSNMKKAIRIKNRRIRVDAI